MSAAAQVLPFLAALKQQQAIQAQPDVQPDLSVGQPPPMPQPTPQPTDNVPDLAQSMTQGQQAPKFHETKGHALMRILQSGVQGGLNGMAANAQTYAQTGRNAGFGGGFAGAEQMPFLQAQRSQALQQGQAQIDLLRQQAQNINVPGYGSMPAGLAKVLFPSIIKGNTATTVQGMKGQTAESVANIQKRFVPVQGVGLFDTQTRQVIPGTENGITITPEIAKDHNLPQEFIGKPMSLQQLAAVQRSDVFQNTPMMTAQGPIVVNRKDSTATPITGPQGQTYSPPALASPREVADKDNPGQTKIVSGGAAIASGAAGPSSASVVVPKAAAKAEVPTNIGNQKVAFNTMIAHAELLRKAAQAVNNGDIRAINSLQNNLKTEFGDGDYTNLEAIANAYNHEVTSVISKGHITEGEVNKGERTLPLNANLATINKVLGTYEQLAQSKMDNLNKQKQSAIDASQPNQQTFTVTDPAGGIHTFKDQKSANAFKAAIGQK